MEPEALGSAARTIANACICHGPPNTCYAGRPDVAHELTLNTNSNLSAVVGIRQQQGHGMFEPNWLSAKHSGALLIKTKRSSNKQPEADFRNLLS